MPRLPELHAGLPQLDSSRQTCGTTTNNETLDCNLWNFSAGGDFVHGGKLRIAFDGLHLHVRLDELHAGFDGSSTRDDHALRTLAVGTEDPLRRVVLRVVSEYADSLGKKC